MKWFLLYLVAAYDGGLPRQNIVIAGPFDTERACVVVRNKALEFVEAERTFLVGSSKSELLRARCVSTADAEGREGN